MVQQIVDGTGVIFQYARDVESIYHILEAPAVVIDHDHRIVSINQSMCRLASTDEEDARGRRCFEIIHGLSGASENCPFSTVRDSAKHTSRHIYLESVDSHFLVTTYPVFDVDSIFAGALCVLNELAGWKDFELNMAEQRNMFRDFLEHSNDLVAMLAPSGNFIYVNPAFKSALKYSGYELRRFSLWDLLSPESLDEVRNAMADLLSGTSPWHGSLILIDSAGMQVPVQGEFACSFSNEEPEYVRMIFRNLTDTRRLEHELTESNEQLRTLIDAIPDFICLKDGEGRWLQVNEAVRKFFRIEEKDYAGKTDFEVAAASMRYRSFFAKCEALDYEAWNKGSTVMSRLNLNISPHKIATFDVRKVPVFHSDGSRRVMASICKDVSRQVTTETELHSVIRQLNIILENVSSAIALIVDRKIVWVNPAAEKIFEFTPEELQGSGTEILYPSRDAYEEAGRRIYGDMARYGYSRGEVKLRSKRGQDIWCVYSASFVNDEDHSKGIIIALENIQAQKDAWKREQDLQRKMQHAQKLESLGVLAGGIAHDFNNLLMGIMGNTDLCLMKMDPSSPFRKYLEKVRQASQRAADLTSQMLAYSGRGHFIIEPVDLSQVVREMNELLERVISKKARLNFRLHDALPLVRGDISQIRQVVMNLLINASEALGDSPGDLIVSTGTMEVDSRYILEAYLDDAEPGFYVWFEVSDTGVGMDSQTISRIFEPFFTTKFSGRGLGLAAILGIVRGHHGIIRVNSEPGQGTSVRVLFPVHDEMQKRLFEQDGNEAGDKAVHVKSAGVQLLFGKKVLVVDDEKEVRDVARMMIESLGCRVITACNGAEAIKIFQAAYTELAVVLLDLTMPDMDGEAVFHRLRSVDKQTSIVFTSGYSEEDAVKKCGAGNLNFFIQKPYTVSSLAEVLTEAIDGSSDW